MEGGGIDLEPHSQALYEGEVVGLDYYPLKDARLRMLGGSSMHWGGRCRPLEESDFLPRPYAPLGLENPRLLLACNGQLLRASATGTTWSAGSSPSTCRSCSGRPISIGRYPGRGSRGRAGDLLRSDRRLVAEHEVLGFRLRVAPRIEPPLSFPSELARSAGCVLPFAERLSQALLGRGDYCERGGLSMYFAQDGGRQ